MPTYEYECLHCGYRFERMQNMSADPVKLCPECQGEVRRLLGTGSAVLIKGKTGSGHECSYTRCEGSARCCGRDEPCGDAPCDRRG